MVIARAAEAAFASGQGRGGDDAWMAGAEGDPRRRDKGKPFNYNAAKFVLHCNNTITIILALALIIAGALYDVNPETRNIFLKFTVCDKLRAAGVKGVLNMSSAPHIGIGGGTAAAVMRLCRPDGSAEEGAVGHCSSHDDCGPGTYCDEDFVCWDCDYVTQGPCKDPETHVVSPEPCACDAFNVDLPEFAGNPKQACARCMDVVTNPGHMRGASETHMMEVATPEGAEFVGATANMAIGFGMVVLISSCFGFLGDAYQRRTLLFIHHFVTLVLGVAMIYAVLFCFIFRAYAQQMLRQYWPWIRQSFPEGMLMHDAQEELKERLGTVAVLCVMTTMSLWSGVLASGRLLGLRLLAKQMLLMSNGLTTLCGMTTSACAFVSYFFLGYSAASVLGIWFCGACITGLGGLGFIGSYTERAGLLRAQMLLTVPMVLLLLFGGLEAVFWCGATGILLRYRVSHPRADHSRRRQGQT